MGFFNALFLNLRKSSSPQAFFIDHQEILPTMAVSKIPRAFAEAAPTKPTAPLKLAVQKAAPKAAPKVVLPPRRGETAREAKENARGKDSRRFFWSKIFQWTWGLWKSNYLFIKNSDLTFSNQCRVWLYHISTVGSSLGDKNWYVGKHANTSP